eukprot:TRINITY_DN7593_c1_g1::TRINITY_DN7593_c1_g1_i1::g.1976::m.1976 TRINITY_DN7593_c1_g1::TRINITY_DN7593_c1_g1_i1::g.1976  ORF type:complete len:380 (-),score=123.24,sp/Q84UV8/NEC3_NICLS/34.65/5e-24,Carb_anhydrase/PF00194.16/1.9e-10,Carb_anhydrase/PF00194.16/4.6e-09,EGF_3/PF12947.2/7.5e-06,EGF_3/PF12947.2/2.1e-07,EGF_CA/PF07645.10/0.0085,EGF_CA/PF07645.10/2.1e-08,cEGF/PF12662.2/0.00067,cEGF/PF12662.2/49,EGF/PF00008.22/0.019,EGF/PF00008.22/2.9e+02,EGF/PF00008.22/2e+03,EGF_2/PF07974.8/0.13,EGF_2/PF07974
MEFLHKLLIFTFVIFLIIALPIIFTFTSGGDADVCRPSANHCHQYATCISGGDTFNCVCNEGYYGDGFLTCADVNECTTSTDNCHLYADCKNNAGSFTCNCKWSYLGDGVSKCLWNGTWDYEHQDAWPEYCNHGMYQSPIDIDTSKVAVVPIESDANRISIIWTNMNITGYNNTGHTLQYNSDSHEYAKFSHDLEDVPESEELYVLKQFHFHGPSEHTIDGEHADLEVHFVHQRTDGYFIVIGVMYYASTDVEEDPFLADLQDVSLSYGDYTHVGGVVFPEIHPFPMDVQSYLTEGSYYTYKGSLTTPPYCYEYVSWVVIKKPHYATPEQIEFILEAWEEHADEGNDRETMPLNGRVVTLHEVQDDTVKLIVNPFDYVF